MEAGLRQVPDLAKADSLRLAARMASPEAPPSPSHLGAREEAVADFPLQTPTGYLSEYISLPALFGNTDIQFATRQFFRSMGGGMGGMGSGMGSMFTGADSDDDGNFSFHTINGMPGGMPGGMPSGRGTRRPSSPYARASGNSPSRKREPQEITRPLPLSLEDLFNGTTKHLKVSRKLRDGGTAEKILEIKVQPGYKKGTKIRFPDAGNESETGESQAITFVLEEKPHDRFERDDADLILKQREKISLVDALANTGGTRSILGIDGRKHSVQLPPGVIKPGTEVRVHGEGMPIRKTDSPKKRGDLVLKFDVVFPERLTLAQRDGIRKVLG